MMASSTDQSMQRWRERKSASARHTLRSCSACASGNRMRRLSAIQSLSSSVGKELAARLPESRLARCFPRTRWRLDVAPLRSNLRA